MHHTWTFLCTFFSNLELKQTIKFYGYLGSIINKFSLSIFLILYQEIGAYAFFSDTQGSGIEAKQKVGHCLAFHIFQRFNNIGIPYLISMQ